MTQNDNQERSNRPPVLYVFDAYCGWCYGFGATVRELEQRLPGTMTVITGNLFPTSANIRISSMKHIPEANARITELSGVPFGNGYQELLNDGDFVMDSGAAATGFHALKAAGGADVEIATALQRAFYWEGKSLSSPEPYREIAEQLGLDFNVVEQALSSGEAESAARQDRKFLHQLQVTSYPTLLVQTPEGFHQLGSVLSKPDEIEEKYIALVG